jgi:serine protease Do
MNEYDPMKDSASSKDSKSSPYTYRTDDGRGYTNPDGSHGFIYNPDGIQSERRNRRYKGAVIALSMVIVTLLLAICCLVGAFIAARSLHGEMPGGFHSETTVEPNTSGGLSINDDTSEEEDDTLFPNEGNTAVPPDDNSKPAETTPPVASIEKIPSRREDKDGDGMADIEFGEDGQVITSAGSNSMSIATVVNRVAASVVEITTETVAQSDRLGQYITSGAGSGVIISREGFIVTNHHVIEGASTVTVRLNNGKEFAATVVGTDEATDVAVLWIDAAGYELTVATLGSSFDLVVGEDILAIGNPMGSLGGTVTEGMISATARQIKVGSSVMTLLQVSAPINPGNSGGGLFNMAGELVGIVNAKIADESIEGLGFAIPVDTAYDIVLEIIEYGYVRGRPDLGFNIVDVTSVQTAMRYFNSFYTGVYVYDENHGTVKYGDRILTVDGVKISSSAEVIAIAAGKRVGDTLTLEVVRKGDVKTLTVTIAEKKPAAKNADE